MPRRGSVVPQGKMDLAIDPGVRGTGWALFSTTSGALLEACGGGMPPFEHARRVVIELPQVYPYDPVPPNDLITLACLVGRYATAATALEATEVYLIRPHAWKGTMPKQVCTSRIRFRMRPEEVAMAEGCGVPAGQLHNTLDAVGIGLVVFRGIRI